MMLIMMLKMRMRMMIVSYDDGDAFYNVSVKVAFWVKLGGSIVEDGNHHNTDSHE